MELNEMEKKLLFQVEGDYQTKILNELYMTVRYSNNSEQREAAEGLMAKLRVLSNAECMDLVKDMYYFLYGEGWAHTQAEMLERGLTLRQYEEFAGLQNVVLAQHRKIPPIRFVYFWFSAFQRNAQPLPPAMISGVWGHVTNKHLAGIPGMGFLLNTQSYVRLHCLPVGFF